MVIGDAVDYGGAVPLPLLSDLVLRELPVTMIVSLCAIGLVVNALLENRPRLTLIRGMALWAQTLPTTENATNVSICGFIELIILYSRAPWCLNLNNRYHQVTGFEYPYIEIIDVSRCHCCLGSIRHIDSPRYLGMLETARDQSQAPRNS